MSEKIRLGIVGYGNLGKGAELAIHATPDMELSALFSRRQLDHPLYQAQEKIDAWRDKIDVLLLCGGSATDLPKQGPELAAKFNTVDSFDTHARIPEYFSQMDELSRNAKTVAVLSAGWDPGLFSIMRVLGDAILPQGKNYTFWGPGISQGHSDALRRVPGVQDARQYTIPAKEALQRVREGENPELSTREKHRRDCYVVLKPDADPVAVKEAIVTMPNYFADYDTNVTFVSQEELLRDHDKLPHGGSVIQSAFTGSENAHHQVTEFHLSLGSNPEFTASVLVACARAAYRLAQAQRHGAYTMLDIPLGLLSPRSAQELRRDMV